MWMSRLISRAFKVNRVWPQAGMLPVQSPCRQEKIAVLNCHSQSRSPGGPELSQLSQPKSGMSTLREAASDQNAVPSKNGLWLHFGFPATIVVPGMSQPPR
jgi:hypothetical protein